MSAFTGKQHKGAMAERRKEKRTQAQQRDAISVHSKDGRKKREAEERSDG